MGANDEAFEKYAAKQAGIDTSEWLEKSPATKENPHPVHPIETYVKARQKHPPDIHPLDILHRIDILTTRHISVGWFLIRLRAGDLMRLDVARMGEVLRDKSASPSGMVMDGDWIYILDHCLVPWQKKHVERICWKFRDHPITNSWVEESRTAIAESFDALVAAVEKLLTPSPDHEKRLDT